MARQVLAEAQKITAWSDVVKRLWDEDPLLAVGAAAGADVFRIR